MTPPQVPDLPAEWPPTPAQLAVLTTKTHWLLADIAYDLPRGHVDRARLDAAAEALEKLALLMRNHDVGEVTAMGPKIPGGECEICGGTGTDPRGNPCKCGG